MKIDKIKKVSNGKYKIVLEDKTILTTYDNVILNSNILYSKSIDDDLYNKIVKENDYYDYYNKVIKLISKKLRSQYEIEEYLKKNNLKNEDIKKMIDLLKQNGYINDEIFTKAYINDKFNFTSDGPNKIKKDLLDLGIIDNIIENNITILDEKIIKEKLKKIIDKKVKLDHKHSINIIKMKLKQELFNLGYDSYMIEDILNNVSFNNNITKDYNLLFKKLSNKYDSYELEKKIIQKLYQKGYTKEEINENNESVNNFM